ncbi:hypothetical protein BKI52_32740 [marine bacterium AO1-C]|nr:hypothetical protein BKI52_32740 [marine bacterium AO1-C]
MSVQIIDIKKQKKLHSLIYKPFFLFLIFIHICSLSASGQSWKLIKEKDGIKVYARPYQNTKHRELKAFGVFNTSLSSLVAVIKDDKSVPDWINRMKIFKNIKVLNDFQWYTYAELSLPWPYNNRDLISLNTLKQTEDGVIIIDIENKPQFLPKKGKKVRMQHAKGYWRFKSLGNGKTLVTYQFYAQPNLGLPTWIINPLATKGVYNTLKQLRKVVKRSQYQQANISYIRP